MTTGSCMCGEIRYEFTGEPVLTALCHCYDCQKWTGGAFTSNAVVPKANFRLIQGTPKSYDIIGGSGNVNIHFFCPTCGSSLYTNPKVLPDMVSIKAGGLDNGAASLNNNLHVELYTRDRVSYQPPLEGVKQETHFGDIK